MRGSTALTAALLFFALAPAASAQNGGVTISINGTPGATLTSELDQNINVTEPMSLRTRSDGVARPGAWGGTSIDKILELAGIPVSRSTIEKVSMPRIGKSGNVELSADQVIDGIVGDPNFPGAHFANIFTGEGNVVRFFRPMSSASDFNNDDKFTTVSTGDNVPLNVITTGKTIRTLTPTYPQRSPTEDESTDFGVSVDNPDGGEPFTYSWTFGDGTPKVAGQTPSHSFMAGSYQPTVYAFGADGSAGVAVLPDLIVKPKSAATPTPTATPSATATGTPSGGNGPGASGTGGEAPTGGGAGDKRDRTSGPRKSKGRNDDSRKGKAKATATATATAAATATSPPGTGGDDGGGGTSGATPGAEATGTPAAASDPEATPTAAPARPSTPQGERVEGILLADSGTVADILAAARSAEAAEQVRSQARAGGGGSGSVAGWVGGGALLFALLAAGAAREGIFRR